MARPLKRGLDYFSLDVDFFENEKIKILGGMYGIKGEVIWLKLLCCIYRNGYYIEWNKDAARLFSRNFFANNDGVSKGLIDGVVRKVLDLGLLNADLYKNFGILTSHSIQERYLQGVSRRKNIYLVKEFMLVNVDINEIKANIVYLPYNENSQAILDVDNNLINADINSINVCDKTQSKGKEIYTYIRSGINANNNEINARINSISPIEQGIYSQAMDVWQNNIGRVPMGVVADDMLFYLDKVGIEAFRLACEYTNRGNPANKQSYVLKVLSNWVSEGVDSATKARASILERLEQNKRTYSKVNEGEAELRYFGE